MAINSEVIFQLWEIRLCRFSTNLKDLTGIAERTQDLVSSLAIDHDDHPSLLAYAFLQRQHELACSVVALTDVNSHASAALLARTMLEGAMKLHWVLIDEDRERKAKLWRAWAWVEDLRELEYQEQFGFPASEEQKALFSERLEAFPELFKKPDKPHQSWTVDEVGNYKSVKAIFHEYSQSCPPESINVYSFYSKLSALVHWSPSSFNLYYGQSNWLFEPLKAKTIKLTLGLSVASLGMMLSLVSSHFSLNMLDEINSFMEEVNYE